MTFKLAMLAGTALIFTSGWATAQECPNPGMMGMATEFSDDSMSSGMVRSITAGGSIDLSNCPNVPGVGNVIEAPDLSLAYKRTSGPDLSISTSATCDTTLLVNDAAGNWHADDDSGEDNGARILLDDAMNGIIDVWIGTYEESTCEAELTIVSGSDLAPTCPDMGLMGDERTFSSDDLYSEQRLSVVAGGSIDLSECNNLPGMGNVIEAPDFTITYEKNQNYDVRFQSEASCDTVLLINDASGDWHWDDDSGTDNGAEIMLENAEGGMIDVWIGTYDDQTCDATLMVESFDPS